MKIILLFSLCISSITLSAQLLTKKIYSEILGDSREIRIRLPHSFKSKPGLKYPLVLALDGDYIFDPTSGDINYFSYWDDMPECVVVGINQRKTRLKDSRFDTNTNLLDYTGKDFYNFIEKELVPSLEADYRLSPFKIIIGHDLTANFINYFIINGSPLFHAYVNLSPDFAPTVAENVTTAFKNINQPIWYYLATGKNDVEQLKTSITKLNENLSNIENKMFRYSYNNFEDESHYSLVALGIPRALEDIFSVYRPISRKEYKETIEKLDVSAYEYLINKYNFIENQIGVKKKIRVNDILATGENLESTENWEDLGKLGQLARKEYPEHMLGNYFLGLVYEKQGKPKQALRAYQNGFLLQEVSFLTKDIMYKKAERLKSDFGFR